MKKIYIVSTYTGTILSYLIKVILDVPYTHISIGLDENLEELYSFGRLNVNNPVLGGFVRECIDGGLYKKKYNSTCKVYSIELEDEQALKLYEIIKYFIKNKKDFKYDSKFLIKFLYSNPEASEKRFVCSQFVAYVLEASGINLFDKPYYLVTPLDFYNLKCLEVEYEGLLSEYRLEYFNYNNITVNNYLLDN